MLKSFYVPKDKEGVVKEALELFKQEGSVSQMIISGLESAINKKKKVVHFEEHIIDDEGLRVKLVGKKLFTFKSTNDQNSPLVKGNELVARFEIVVYLTKSRRLFAVTKETNNKENSTSRLRNISFLWQSFLSKESGEIGYVDPIDFFEYPEEFFKGMHEAIKKIKDFDNLFVIE